MRTCCEVRERCETSLGVRPSLRITAPIPRTSEVRDRCETPKSDTHVPAPIGAVVVHEVTQGVDLFSRTSLYTRCRCERSTRCAKPRPGSHISRASHSARCAGPGRLSGQQLPPRGILAPALTWFTRAPQVLGFRCGMPARRGRNHPRVEEVKFSTAGQTSRSLPRVSASTCGAPR